MIYVDTLANYGKRIQGHGPYWAHLGTDDHSREGLEALHVFARRLGLKRAWFQDIPNAPHYDVTTGKHAQALRLGALLLTRTAWVQRCAPVLWARAMAHESPVLRDCVGKSEGDE